MNAILCTSNSHKVQEFQSLFPQFEVAPLENAHKLPPETATTFKGNALIKARGGRLLLPEEKRLSTWIFADDSGLECDALDGAPGIRSARFAGEDASDSDNVQKLLQLMPVKNRGARFVCVIIAIAPNGKEFSATGTVEGTIANTPSGDKGFGYDPVFIPEGYSDTFSLLGEAVKSEVSHRARAASKLIEGLVDFI